MKRIVLLSLLTLALGCKKSDMVDGGYSFRDIYLLQESVLVDAQNHVEQIGNKGGTIVLEYVSFWINHIETRQECDGITISYSPSEVVPSEEAFYDKVIDNRYKQTVTVTVRQNDGRESRKAAFRIHTRGGDGHAADLIIKQVEK